MKKAKTASRRAPAKGKGPKTVDEYMARVPKQAKAAINKLRVTIRSAVPAEATETISYGIPAVRLGLVVVWFAAFSDHCSLFPTAAVIDLFQKELKGFSTSKGTIHFPLDKPLPTTLIKRVVKARLAQLKAKKQGAD